MPSKNTDFWQFAVISTLSLSLDAAKVGISLQLRSRSLFLCCASIQCDINCLFTLISRSKLISSISWAEMGKLSISEGPIIVAELHATLVSEVTA